MAQSKARVLAFIGRDRRGGRKEEMLEPSEEGKRLKGKTSSSQRDLEKQRTNRRRVKTAKEKNGNQLRKSCGGGKGKGPGSQESVK